MSDAGEGLIDNDARIQERMEELAREKRADVRPRDTRDPEQVRALESLKLARTELQGQLAATTNDRRRAQLIEALAEVDRRIAAAGNGAAKNRVQPALVHAYHDGTKHQFNRFARSLGYLDWASQPRPFRAFDGSPVFPLYPAPAARDRLPEALSEPLTRVAYAELFGKARLPSAVLDARSVGDLLRHSLGLSAWKQVQQSRWSLRVNPSSGNLHPTEAYVVCGAMPGMAGTPGVYHYAADRHALDLRCTFDSDVWLSACGRESLLVALTSIHWREAWKYGERAFRYCQHDLGHAIGAVRIAAGILGWRARLLPSWSHEAIAAIAGVDRDEDFVDAEREEPGCIILIESSLRGETQVDDGALRAAVKAGKWSGRSSQLSEDHVQWTFIDEIAEATRDPRRDLPASPALPDPPALPALPALVDARSLVLQRRSALAFDRQSSVSREHFVRMLAAVCPADRLPWDALWWKPRLHLVLFVHRVDGVPPGLYCLIRREDALDRVKAAMRSDFEWDPIDSRVPLFRLARGDCRGLAERLSCDQEIAADGFFSLGMIAEFDASLLEYGPSFYRHLFWESGLIGQVLYLEAEACGARATGIGCFYDDPVHTTLGLADHAFQSLYHFTVGVPVDDTRLTTESGYGWDAVNWSARVSSDALS